MNLMARLHAETAEERHYLLTSPIIADALLGKVTREQYVAFLGEAYFHVSQTVPLLMACGSRLDRDKEWLRAAVARYIEEEYGHEIWILNDIAACGADATGISHGRPSLATELLIAYAWYTVQTRNPLGFFGMVYVLEGTSIALATRAAEAIRGSVSLSANAFTYLRSHGEIDQTHIQFLESLLNRIDDPDDVAAIMHASRVFYRLYADMFRSLPDANAAAKRPEFGRRVA